MPRKSSNVQIFKGKLNFSELIFGSSKVVSEDVLDLFETFKFHLPPECERIFNVMIERNIRVMERNEYTKQLSAELDGAVHPAARDCDVGFDMEMIKSFHQTNLRKGFSLEKIESFFEIKHECETELDYYDEHIPLNNYVPTGEAGEYFEAQEKCFDLAWVEFIKNEHLFLPERIEKLASERDCLLVDYVKYTECCHPISYIIAYELIPDEIKMLIYNNKLNSCLSDEKWSQFAHLLIDGDCMRREYWQEYSYDNWHPKCL